MPSCIPCSQKSIKSSIKIAKNKDPVILAKRFIKSSLSAPDRKYSSIKKILDREPRPQVFRAGNPVDRAQEAFIPRDAVIGELDRQLTLAVGTANSVEGTIFYFTTGFLF